MFEKAFAQRERFDPAREFWPWLASIAARACIDAHRRSASAEARHHQYARDTHREPFDVTSSTVLRDLDRRRLGHHISALPSRQRAALGLFAVDGWSYEQIAHHLGDSTTAVKALIQRARATLRASATKWAAVVGGAGRVRLRRLAGIPGSPWWPTWQALGPSASALAGSVVAAVLMVTTVPSTSATSVLAERIAVRNTTTEQEAVDGKQAATATSPRPPRAPSPVGVAERAGNDLLASTLPAADMHDQPDTIRAESFATSPDYERDPTLFVAGRYAGSMNGVPVVPLLVSHDGGASWRTARATGLLPVVKLLLPPAYPRDPRLFAVTVKGLQVSHDDGESFETVLPLSQIDDAAFPLDFGDPETTMLLVVGGRLWQYDERSGALSAVGLRGPLAMHLVGSVGYAGDTIVLGTRLPDPVLGNAGVHVSRCAKRTGPVGVELECDTVELPSARLGLSERLVLRIPPAIRSGIMYVALPEDLRVSTDGGATFRTVRSWSPGRTFTIHDLARVPSSAGLSALVAQLSYPKSGSGRIGPQLARTDDGGRTWTEITVDLPRFDWAERVIVTSTGRIIAGSFQGGLACSEDDGRSWARLCPTPDTA